MQFSFVLTLTAMNDWAVVEPFTTVDVNVINGGVISEVKESEEGSFGFPARSNIAAELRETVTISPLDALHVTR